MYIAQTPVLSMDEASELGQFLRRYEVQLTGLTVYHLLANGQRVKDDPAADTIKDTATSGGAGGMGGAGLAAAGLTVAPVVGLIAAVSLPFLVGAMHSNRKKIPGGRAPEPPVSSELQFDLADVSARRRRWCEYLLSIYAARHGWTLAGLNHPDQLALGAAYVASHAGDPPPWGDRIQAPAWATRGSPRRGGSDLSASTADQAPQRTAGTNAPSTPNAARRLLRDLW